MKHKVLLRITLFRFGAKRFEQDLNCMLDHGWEPYDCGPNEEIINWDNVGWFRTLLLAHLIKREGPVIRQGT